MSIRTVFHSAPLHWLLSLLAPPKIMYIGGSDVLPPPLKGQAEQDMLDLLAQGDEQAKQTLIEHNLRLVVYIARRFENVSTGLEDLISIGTIGLIKAVNTFDPAKKIKLAENVDFGTVARMASGASGAELANIVNEAALRAVRDGRRLVTQADLEESIETVIAGYQKKNAILTDKEKWIVSYHEIGHALVAARQTHSAPVQKITIIPRTSGALGYTMQVEEGNHYLMSREEIENKIATFTGGRAAEEVVFGSVTTGASNDIEQATKLARAMLTRYGMSDEFGMVALETVTNQYLGGDASLACSPETQAKIDQLVVDLVERQHQKALQILRDDRQKLDELAKFLHEKETITGQEFMQILNG